MSARYHDNELDPNIERGKKVPLKADYLKFVDKFVHEQDVNRAAMSAGYTAKYGHKLYAMPEVRAEIDKRLEVLNLEKAKLLAQVEVAKLIAAARNGAPPVAPQHASRVRRKRSGQR
jgi:phage terminase small subunit